MKRDKTKWIQEVVARYERPLCQYAFRLTGNYESARDAVQDVFLKLWRAESWRTNAPPRGCSASAATAASTCSERTNPCKRSPMPGRGVSRAGRSPAEEASLRESASLLCANWRNCRQPSRSHPPEIPAEMSYREIAAVTSLSETKWLPHPVGIQTLRRQTAQS
jgi:hypothetical protein